MGRRRSPIRKKVVGIFVPVELATALKGYPGLSEKTEDFWRGLLNEPTTPDKNRIKAQTIQTKLTEMLEQDGEQTFRSYFRETHQLEAEAIIIQRLHEEHIQVTPSELSAVMFSSFRGLASA